MLTGSFGHETSDIVSRIQTSLLLVNLYLDNGMDINQIKDVVSIVSGDFDRIYAYSNLIVNFLRKRKRTIDSEINLSSALKEVGGFYQTIVKSFDITLNFVCEDTIEYKIKQIDFESMSKMDELIGLFIEDEAANVDVYTRLFALEGLKLDCLDKLPLTVDSYYDIILEKNVDFLIIDFHLEKQVTYKGIDVLREIRKHDSTIYAVLLTNYELDDLGYKTTRPLY